MKFLNSSRTNDKFSNFFCRGGYLWSKYKSFLIKGCKALNSIQVQSDLGVILVYAGREVRWPSGRVSDSRARGRGFDPHSCRRVVSLSKIHLPPKRTGNTQQALAPSKHDRKIVNWNVKQK